MRRIFFLSPYLALPFFYIPMNHFTQILLPRQCYYLILCFEFIHIFCFYFSNHSQKPRNPIHHICGLGASVGCEHFKRTFNTPRLKSQIWCMGFRGFVCFVSTNQKLLYRIKQKELKIKSSALILCS